jgi:hypothetical protein
MSAELRRQISQHSDHPTRGDHRRPLPESVRLAESWTAEINRLSPEHRALAQNLTAEVTEFFARRAATQQPTPSSKRRHNDAIAA